ncbi:DUF1642 domain-containing protein [Lactococcus petauri]|uniref:DUF1642 domain-containing protein n=1 Tax=Lactococcus petauri TaxID=1940789 RepID=UPI0022E5FBA9|nr:DUF1642 domain-containing protein [Lactococcus petauri]
MKKFEEKLKKLNVEVIKHPIGDTHYLLKNQVESIVRKADKEINWLHSLLDERNEEVLQTVKRLNEAQPETPVVPQLVADWLDKKPLYTINSFIPVEIIEWSKKQTGYADLGMNINHLLKLKVNGYTVETPKEKRFYLKNKFTGNYLSSVPESSDFYHVMVRDPKVNGLVRSFTKQEIDSMETGSYEQIGAEE